MQGVNLPLSTVHDNRHLLLLQERWFSQAGGLPDTAIATLQSLPIYRQGALPTYPTARGNAAAATAEPGESASDQPGFVGLLGPRTRLPPPGTDPALLSWDYVIAATPEEAAVLANRLGVPQHTAAQVTMAVLKISSLCLILRQITGLHNVRRLCTMLQAMQLPFH